MKQHKQPKVITWFEQQNRQHLTFLIAIGLIAVLFIAALIGVLTGRYKPFADIGGRTGLPYPKLNNALNVGGGTITYRVADGSTKSINNNAAPITVQAITQAAIGLQSANLSRFTSTGGKLTIHTDGSDPEHATIRNLVLTSNGTKDENHIKFTINTNSYRDPMDGLTPQTAVTAILKTDHHLAVKQTGITNFRDLGNFPVAPAGDANNDNRIDGADFAVSALHYGQTVTPLGQFDANGDGIQDGADFAVWAANYGRVGENY